MNEEQHQVMPQGIKSRVEGISKTLCQAIDLTNEIKGSRPQLNVANEKKAESCLFGATCQQLGLLEEQTKYLLAQIRDIHTELS